MAGSDTDAFNATGITERWANDSDINFAASRPPRIYFLFLAVDKVSNLDVWNAFFSTAPVHEYRAYVHCKLPSCLLNVQGSRLEPVPTVPSYYCTDLVSPMNQLLSIALRNDADGANPADKFAFVSDSTLPAKPFPELYATLSMRKGSDFCVFPTQEWADIPASGGGIEIAVKTHQWVTLERYHAEQSLLLWSNGRLQDFMNRFRMNMDPASHFGNGFGDNRNYGCLDEFWHMIALYGAFTNTGRPVKLPGFSGGTIDIGPGKGWQGTCDTFVVWAKYMGLSGYNPFLAMHTTLDAASIPHGGNFARPGWWDTISSSGIHAIRSSDFLFARKFIDRPFLSDGASFEDAYKKIVLDL